MFGVHARLNHGDRCRSRVLALFGGCLVAHGQGRSDAPPHLPATHSVQEFLPREEPLSVDDVYKEHCLEVKSVSGGTSNPTSWTCRSTSVRRARRRWNSSAARWIAA